MSTYGTPQFQKVMYLVDRSSALLDVANLQQVRRHVLCLKGTIPVSHNLHNLRHNLYKISHNFHNYGHNPYNLSHNLKKKIPGEDSTSSCTPKRNEEVNVTRKHALESILLKSSLVATMWKERGSDHNAKRLKGPGYGALAKL
ncbi:hypothetical protein PC128_g23439 [Phytophthora cactorum]|nr:hypothetical protein PC120_g24630 [Phytophthora cactorum]KAG3149229.1 hypothetical protein PC128_g23439 [Phytophthora cactorum]